MREVVYTLKMSIHDDDFNSKEFQEFMKEANECNTDVGKVEFKEDFPKSELIEATMVVK